MRKAGIFILAITMLFMAKNVFCDVTADQMIPVLRKVKADVTTTLTGIDKDLAEAAKKLAIIDLKSSDARNILLGVCKDRPYVVDCAIIDLNGSLSVVEPAMYKDYEGKDVSSQEQVKEALLTKKPLVSKVFNSLEGANRVDFEYPIVNDKGVMLGTVSLLVSQDILLKDIIAPLAQDKSFSIWVMQTDGVILYDPDPNQINKNIFSNPMFESFKDLVSFSKTMAETPSGIGSYNFYKKGLTDTTVVKKDAVWNTVGLYDTQWRIVAMEISEDQPVL